MSGALVISGTDTGIGKTVVAAGLAAALGAHYWKPIQAGTVEGTDSGTARELGVPAEHVVPEAYRLAAPASPHLAAQQEGLALDPARLDLPVGRPLIVEGAGGLMVPIRRDPPWLMIDQFGAWGAPVLLVARTGLGTINHSLLSIEALKVRGIPVAGIVFVGDEHVDNESVIPDMTGVSNLGRVPMIEILDFLSLERALARLDLAAIRAAMGLAG
ncbi:MAG: dethiobiotin synthase [Sphingobium sp.]|nr:dethiobiotin synthase [Sphingobium sp.]